MCDRCDGGVVIGCRYPLRNEGMGVVNEGKRQPRTFVVSVYEIVKEVFIEQCQLGFELVEEFQFFVLELPVSMSSPNVVEAKVEVCGRLLSFADVE